MVYPCIPQFFYVKVGFKGVYIARTCFPDANIGHIFSPFTYMCVLHYSRLIMDVVHLNIHRFVESFEYS